MAERESDMQSQLKALQASMEERNGAVAAQLQALQEANAALTAQLRQAHAARRPVSKPTLCKQTKAAAPAAVHTEAMAAIQAEVRL